jgi:CubicO group peptidase (beta-lactamase class C family)
MPCGRSKSVGPHGRPVIPESLKDELATHLGELATNYGVPGAQLAVAQGDDVWDCSTGYLNLNTKETATTDSLFQIGSIGKVYTATLVMQLVDEGRIDLDAPVRSYLPNLRFSNEEASQRITIRQLLSHTSGVDGDHFGDFGTGDDAIERYVASTSQLAQLFEPGEMFSYCNAGFAVLGRMLEVIHTGSWHDVTQNRLLVPLGAHSTQTLLPEIVKYRVATGHQKDATGMTSVVKQWGLPHAAAPMGAGVCASARDVIAFARIHLEGGRRILSEQSVRAMQQPNVTLPKTSPETDSWGLGWSLFDWNGVGVVGHDGAVGGQRSWLRFAPNKRVAAVLLTNSYTGGPLVDGLFSLVFKELAGVTKPAPEFPTREEITIDPSRFVGDYARLNISYEVSERDGNLWYEERFGGGMNEVHEDQGPRPLTPVDRHSFMVFDQESAQDVPVQFLGSSDGRAQYLYEALRVTPRVE